LEGLSDLDVVKIGTDLNVVKIIFTSFGLSFIRGA